MSADPHESPGPKRRHHLILSLQADTREALVQALEQFATDIARDQVTGGCYGSPSSGAIYSYRVRPDMDHDSYFTALKEWLEAERTRHDD